MRVLSHRMAQEDGGNTDVDHMNTVPKETCKMTNKKDWEVSMKAQ